MKKFITTTLLIFSLLFNCSSQANKYFPNLRRVLIDSTYKVYFSYDAKSTSLINEDCSRLPKESPYFNDFDILEILIGKYKSETLKDSITLIYSQGPSADPTLLLLKGNKLLKSINGLEYILNSNDLLYISGHTDNMFDERKKFKIYNDSISEIKQPLYYVGLKGKLKKPITLYYGEDKGEVIAQLPINYPIEILLAKPKNPNERFEYYLIRTDFGLIGWLKIDLLQMEDIYNGIIDGLFFAGD